MSRSDLGDLVKIKSLDQLTSDLELYDVDRESLHDPHSYLLFTKPMHYLCGKWGIISEVLRGERRKLYKLHFVDDHQFIFMPPGDYLFSNAMFEYATPNDWEEKANADFSTISGFCQISASPGYEKVR